MNRLLALALSAAIGAGLSTTLIVPSAEAGSFRSHKNYKVSGTATKKGNKVTLSGFRTSSGPDLYVYVGKGSASRRVAKLRANSGTQSYTLPAGDWTSVHIHCRKFNSTFGTASIR